jgi:endonuclease/exonuclease/phosphatase family metal-dependent hydrolase
MMDVNILEFNISCFWGMAQAKLAPLVHFLLTAIRYLQAEVVVLIEAWDATLKRQLIQHVGREWSWQQRPEAAGVLVGVKGEFENVHALNFPGCCQLDCLVRKGALHCAVSVRGRRLDVVAVHFQSYQRNLCDDVRMQQVKMVRQYVQSLARPVVVVGDFNVVMYWKRKQFYEFAEIASTLGTPCAVSPTPWMYDHNTWTIVRQPCRDVHMLSTYPYRFGTGPGIVDYALLAGAGSGSALRLHIIENTQGLAMSDHFPVLIQCRLRGHNNLTKGRSEVTHEHQSTGTAQP